MTRTTETLDSTKYRGNEENIMLNKWKNSLTMENQVRTGLRGVALVLATHSDSQPI
jgi:hypothetical protein